MVPPVNPAHGRTAVPHEFNIDSVLIYGISNTSPQQGPRRRCCAADGSLAFNTFATISFDVARNAYSMRSHAMGNAGDFPVTITDDGFRWEIAAGPMTIRYTAVVKDGIWTETGTRQAPGQEPVEFFGMKLQRLGDTDWPAGGALAP